MNETGPVLILGAGATKACEGPLTNEILPEASTAIAEIERDGNINLVKPAKRRRRRAGTFKKVCH